MKRILSVIFFLTICITTQAQYFKYKVGKAEFPILDPNLEIDDDAIYLYSEGYAGIEYVSTKQDFRLVTDHQFCIQILNKNGFDHANIEIPYYVSGATREEVRRIKAFTYNYENGEFIKTKLNPSDIYREEIDLHHRKMKFAMPGVKEGSIIEISYHKESPFFFNFDRWAFQRSIPVVHSLYTAVIPEYFRYHILQKGYEEAHDYNEKVNPVTVTGQSLPNGMMVYNTIEYFWEFRNVPPLKRERFTPAVRDYASSVEMELASISFPGAATKEYSITWDDFDEYLKKHEFFGQQLKKFNFLTDDLEVFQAGRNGKEIPVTEVIDWVQSKMAWDGYVGFLAGDHLRKCYSDGSGNVSAMNLILIGALRELGYDAHPVLLSTRSHGKVLPSNPRISGFNYVVTGIDTGEGFDLIDVSRPCTFPKFLPEHCLNGQFRMQRPKGGEWIEYKVPTSQKNSLVNGKIAPDGTITGEVSTSQNGYYGLDVLEEEKEGEEGESAIIGSCPGELKYENFKVAEPNENSPNVKTTFDFSVSGVVEDAEDLLFFPVGLLDVFEENPFRAEERLYPVDFGYPFQDTQILELEIPEGYKVESLPESAVVRFPGKKGVFMFQVNQPEESKVLLTRTLIVSKPLFYAEEYQGLKEFFDHIIKKENEQIVLQKI